MNLLNIIPVQNSNWNILNNDISLERLNQLSKVYIMTKTNNLPYIGIIQEVDDNNLLLKQNDDTIKINLNDITCIEDVSTSSISPFFCLGMYDYTPNRQSFDEIINTIKETVNVRKMFVCITNKNNKCVYGILEDIDNDYIYYTIKYKENDEILTKQFKEDLKTIYNIEEVHLASLFENSKIEPLDYLKSSTNYLTKFNEEDIKLVKADMYNNLYVLLNNNDLYINDNKVTDIKEIYALDYHDIFAITNNNKILSLNSEIYQDYFGECEYDKIITYIFGIAALKNGELKLVLNFETTSAFEYKNFVDVEDIKVDDEETEIYVQKNGKWIKLFIN